MTRRRRWTFASFVAIAVLAVLAVLGGARTVSAHADLVSSDPPADSVLAASPAEIVLTFTEPVDPVDNAVRLVAADGTPVALGSITQDSGSDTITALVPDEITDGSYVVAWAAVSADSHPIRGAFVFSVGAPSPGASGLVDEVLTEADTSTASDLWVGVGRFAGYTGIAVLVGTLAAAALIAPSLLQTRRAAHVVVAGGVIAMVGTAVMIAAQAHTISGSYTDVAAVTDTRSGRWWAIRLVTVALITPAVHWRHLLRHRPMRVIAAVGVLGLFAVVAAGGHAVSGRAVGIGFAATIVHLAAMSLWVGGLCLLVFVVTRDRLWPTAARFSPFALGSVVALVVSGAINGWRQVGSLAGIIDSSYGRWLVVKLVIVAAVVAVAAVTRRLIDRTVSAGRPGSVEAGPANGVGDVNADAKARAAVDPTLRRSVIVEAIGMVVILAATACLTGAAPPRAATAAGATAAAGDVTVSVIQGDRIAQIDLLPATTGGTTMHVTITSPRGGLDRADDIAVTAALTDRQVGPLEIPTVPAGPNHVIANEADFPIPGRWTITVTARYGEFDQVVFTADVAIGAP